MGLLSSYSAVPSPPPPCPLLSKSHQPNHSHSHSTTDPPPRVKVPPAPAPWMTTPPLLLPPSDPPNARLKDPSFRRPNTTRSLTKRIPNGRTRKTVLEIIKSVKSLPNSQQPIYQSPQTFQLFDDQHEDHEEGPHLPWIAGTTDPDAHILVFRRQKKMTQITQADKTIAPHELQRLRSQGTRIQRWVKAKKAGITPQVVQEIKTIWRFNELAMVKIVDPLKRNMDRARQIVEAKTGGLVVLTKRDSLIIYRGNTKDYHRLSKTEESEEEKSIKKSLYEREADRLLHGLGPRFIDWWWQGPLPVDADLLPEVVAGFKTPFRQCPPSVRPTLSDEELTWLRHISQALPTHFALGKNKNLQGLAEAIIKLWEKSLVAKIAIKVGMYTDHAQMASELKRLTGGVVILRNKNIIILYRGKDFITEKVANIIADRENDLYDEQNKEEEARIKASSYFNMDRSVSNSDCIGSFKEYQDIKLNYIKGEDEDGTDKIKFQAKKMRLEKELKDHERKLFILRKKIERSEREMADLKTLSGPLLQDSDKELLTEEERCTLRSIGLKMNQHLLLGRRGVYDEVIANVHQHWKHREVVKVITKQTGIRQITYTSKLLELMTGGTLVAVEKVRSHHVIIIFRGKNYHRPITLHPDNLLNKKEALRRSIEAQRRGSLKYFARQREQAIKELKYRLGDLDKELEEKLQTN